MVCSCSGFVSDQVLIFVGIMLPVHMHMVVPGMR